MLLAVKVERKLKGLTHQQIADAIGVSRPFVCLMLRGQRRPALGTARRFAGYLGVSTDELVEYLDSLLLEPAAA